MVKTLQSNEFWGRRSGSVHKDGGLYFKQPQWGTGSSNSTPKKKGMSLRPTIFKRKEDK